MGLRRTIAVAVTSCLALPGAALGAVVAGGAPAAAAVPADLFISEYVEGSGFSKAVEIFNGTGAPVDLAAGGYTLELYSNGAGAPSQTVALAGTVADGDVWVVSRSDADAAVVAQTDQLAPAVANWNGDDAIVLRRGGAALDVIGQIGVDPGTEWGTGLTSTADNTLRRLPTIDAGDADGGDPFDPAAQWAGFAQNTFDGLGSHTFDPGTGNQPVTVACGGPISTLAGTPAEATVTATDPDGTVVAIDVTAVDPAPAAGTITRTALTPAPAPGGPASATITVDAGVPAGTYAVEVTATNDDGTPQTATCTLTVTVQGIRPIGEVQGPVGDTTDGATFRSPLVGQQVVVQGVVTQKTLARESDGDLLNGFFLQDTPATADGDPTTSDGVFVFLGRFTTLLRADGGTPHPPAVGEQLVLRATVGEFFNLTQLTGARLLAVTATGLDPDVDVAVTEAAPPTVLADANRYWERHEGERLRVPAGSLATSGRDVFPSTADSEVWVIRPDDPLAGRDDPYARRVFRDPHPLDNEPGELFDDGNGNRIMLGSIGVKAATGDSFALLPPVKVLDTLDADAVGGLYFSFGKYGIQVEGATFSPGPDLAANAPPAAADRAREVAVSTYNLENLYDYRDDPDDGCDFAGNTGCPGVRPPFDYVPASQEIYDQRLVDIAAQVTTDLHSPDILLTQEAEDQDICTPVAGALACGGPEAGDGKPDTLQELALAIAAAGGGDYDAAFDRNGADDRGIVSAVLFRTDRVSLVPAAADDPVLGASPAVEYRSPGLPSNTDVSNPKTLNAVLPDDVDKSTGVDGTNVYTRAPQVAHFRVAAAPGSVDGFDLWALSNHFSSGPDGRVGQRTEQAAYAAAIVDAIEAADPQARVVVGGDFNVFPRPDDPFAPGHPLFPSDQLGPLYEQGMANLWDDLVADVPVSAYSYTFQGQAQTLDQLFVNAPLHDDLVQVRAAHVNAGWPADFPGDGARGLSDHDPQVARFASRAGLSVADVSVTEGDRGWTDATFTVSFTRPLGGDITVCLLPLPGTASLFQDFDLTVPCTTLASGQTSVDLAIPVRGDRRPEEDETFTAIAFATGGVRAVDPTATGTIVDDD
ncbi:MAG TPA: lamin tail domain-containing protein [Acidimicrobiales bacterium]|nr:lamin tail domain-containing protein [Acidimicrobiales bacterium]